MDDENDGGSFDALLGELEMLAKAQGAKDEKPDADDKAGDEKIAAAAADADGDGKADHKEPDGDEGEGGEGDEDGDELPLGKSFSVIVDGESMDAYDGREALEMLAKSIGEQRTLSTTLEQRTETLAKALGGAGRIIKSLEQRLTDQDALIKSLQGDVTRIGSQPAGRKAMLTVHDKPGAVADGPAAPSREETFAKALSAQKAGRIGALDVARVEAALGRGQPVPSDVAARLA